MATDHETLWELTTGRPQIDPAELAAALEEQVGRPPLDVRTRLLIRDSMNGLRAYWGDRRLDEWLSRSARRVDLEQIWRSDLGPEKFPSLQHRIMNAIRPETVRQFFRELGMQVSSPLSISVGGAIALILDNKISRATEDIDLVDEVPPELRGRHELLESLARRYGLHLTHFQSHFLPTGWQLRVHSLGRFGQLDVFLVDALDIFAGKLFSAREKDLDDLRGLAIQLDRSVARRRVFESGQRLMADPGLAEQAAKNWYILYGETLDTTHS
jgi:hypothetical protein